MYATSRVRNMWSLCYVDFGLVIIFHTDTRALEQRIDLELNIIIMCRCLSSCIISARVNDFPSPIDIDFVAVTQRLQEEENTKHLPHRFVFGCFNFC